MSLVIRLSRTGKRGERKFRIVVQEKRSRRDGHSVEMLGAFEKDTSKSPNFKRDRYDYWISQGAKPSLTVSKIAEQ